jgi:hypothetical protein
MGGFVASKSIGMKPIRSENMTTKLKNNSIRTKRHPTSVPLALCLESKANIDLDPGKLYRVLPDRKARQDGYVRVIDESGEDYLYPAAYFRIFRVAAPIANRLVPKA